LTLLFLGSFRHLPNQEALNWFVSEVIPRVRAEEPGTRLVVIGSDPPPKHSLRDAEGIELVGFVQDVREPLGKYAVFVCPILSGSGMRVKLLEAFAAGIPVVSTRLGAEGLASEDGGICALADDAVGFGDRVVRLLRDPAGAAEMARRARADVVENRDMRRMTERMVESYEEIVERMRDQGVARGSGDPPSKPVRRCEGRRAGEDGPASHRAFRSRFHHPARLHVRRHAA